MPPDEHAGSDMDYLLLWITLLVGLGPSVCGHARHLSIYGIIIQVLRYSVTMLPSYSITALPFYYVTALLRH